MTRTAALRSHDYFAKPQTSAERKRALARQTGEGAAEPAAISGALSDAAGLQGPSSDQGIDCVVAARAGDAVNADRFLVFVRSGDHAWHAVASCSSLGLAVHEADSCVKQLRHDRASVMEVSGAEAMPMFTWKYAAVKK